jgi:hypothetical protein
VRAQGLGDAPAAPALGPHLQVSVCVCGQLREGRSRGGGGGARTALMAGRGGEGREGKGGLLRLPCAAPHPT